MDDQTRPLDPANPAAIEAAVRLHGALLPDSPVSRLGPAFMRWFYYRTLVQDKLVCCDLSYVGGAPAGFIAYTKYSSDFMALGFRRHWLHLAGVMGVAALRHPPVVREVLRVVSLMLRRKQQAARVVQGEILSFGVLPEYRSVEFVRRTGWRISLELYERAKKYFQDEGVPSFRMLVQAENRETLLFYSALGCQLCKEPGGDPKTVQVIYTFEGAGERGPAGSAASGSAEGCKVLRPVS